MGTQNIKELVDQALKLCEEQGFAKSSIHGKHKIFKAVIRKHEENGFADFNEEVLAGYVKEQEKKYEDRVLLTRMRFFPLLLRRLLLRCQLRMTVLYVIGNFVVIHPVQILDQSLRHAILSRLDHVVGSPVTSLMSLFIVLPE